MFLIYDLLSEISNIRTVQSRQVRIVDALLYIIRTFIDLNLSLFTVCGDQAIPRAVNVINIVNFNIKNKNI